MRAPNLLREALIDRACAARWNESDWGLAVRQARSSNLLAALAALFADAPSVPQPPAAAREHLIAARQVVAHRNAAVRWEAERIRQTLASVGLQPIFLKGAAYIVAELSLAAHRNFSDIDVLVPQTSIALAEQRLTTAGWLQSNRDLYDQRYYRQWMHEIPALQHARRGTMLDLHHALSPPTSRYNADTPRLFAAQVQARSLAGASVLSPADMVLHAALHLFGEGEVENGLRNLYDIAELLNDFQQASPGFLDELAERAESIGLARPLFYAVRYLQRVLERPGLTELQRRLARAAPGPLALQFMDAVYDQVFQGHHPSVWPQSSQWRRSALYLRGHWLRMPMHLLVPHLATKAVKSLKKDPTKPLTAPNEPARP